MALRNIFNPIISSDSQTYGSEVYNLSCLLFSADNGIVSIGCLPVNDSVKDSKYQYGDYHNQNHK